MAVGVTTFSSRPLRTAGIEIFATVVAWVVFYYFSAWLFSLAEYSHFISWVFLPAGVRLLAVLLLGWRGVAGIFIGSILTNDASISVFSLVLSAISALAPYFAVHFCQRFLRLPWTLQGLTYKQLLIFSLAGAVFNSVLTNIYLCYMELCKDLLGIVPMLIGDFLGTLLMLYAGAYLLMLAERNYKKTLQPPPTAPTISS